MKLYEIDIQAQWDKPVKFFTVHIYEAKETEKTYSGKGFRIDKDKVMAINSYSSNYSPSGQSYFTYCLPEDVDKAKKMLFDKVKERVCEFEKYISGLRKQIDLFI